MGAVRLLDAIKKHNSNYLCNDWEKVKSKSYGNVPLSNIGANNLERVSYKNRFSPLANEDDGGYADDRHIFYNTKKYPHQKRNEIQNTRLHRRNKDSSNNYERHSHLGGHQPPPSPSLRPVTSYLTTYKSPPPMSSYTRPTKRGADLGVRREQRGCFQCGEYNHTASTCRFDHKLKCGSCKQLGHKSKFCQNYSY